MGSWCCSATLLKWMDEKAVCASNRPVWLLTCWQTSVVSRSRNWWWDWGASHARCRIWEKCLKAEEHHCFTCFRNMERSCYGGYSLVFSCLSLTPSTELLMGPFQPKDISWYYDFSHPKVSNCLNSWEHIKGELITLISWELKALSVSVLCWCCSFVGVCVVFQLLVAIHTFKTFK